jgi:hypothetical protein
MLRVQDISSAVANGLTDGEIKGGLQGAHVLMFDVRRRPAPNRLQVTITTAYVWKFSSA